MIKLFTWLFAAGKLGKLFLTGGTMILSMLVYSWIFGWPYAVGFVLLIFVHEMGHYVAARQRGLQVGAPTFIPFVGAWIALKEMPHSVETEAYVGFAGPLAGSAAALVCYWLGRTYDSNLMLVLAYSGFMLNLFNLIPISPLDGFKVLGGLLPKDWYRDFVQTERYGIFILLALLLTGVLGRIIFPIVSFLFNILAPGLAFGF